MVCDSLLEGRSSGSSDQQPFRARSKTSCAGDMPAASGLSGGGAGISGEGKIAVDARRVAVTRRLQALRAAAAQPQR